MKTRIMTIQIDIEVPVEVGESTVEREINAALDEPPCDWGNWTVGLAIVTKAIRAVKQA